MTQQREIKQALQDWIGEDLGTIGIAKSQSYVIHRRNAVNKFKAELRASLPSLLAKIEQQRLLDRKDELINTYNKNFIHWGDDLAIAKIQVRSRIRKLDALLNTKGGNDE